ncbi:MAG: MucB/RseB C-terminal domain-containing protein [Burkholderiales bacterium]|nr:MucB/RseB C-terminal domain-containing protein [Burkholderiales bacterium]MDE1926348.1 MucB/RseB C-terminal domain-containing protein [Burkholderiales bacterium]MDE2159224.1 MucB/RseB C-terminal domain-containing protein [Burkholderiales bacterium]MDE2504645.1 MucB/RseB C-terminal domain-containing protein [Burkholderiales bacterium]
MRPLPVARWLPLALLLACVLQAHAGSAEGPVAPLEGRAWLARIRAAADSGNYRGTMVFSAGGAITASRVSHYVVGEQVYEELESLDGRQQRIVRHNDDVQTLWPQRHLAVIEKRETLSAWSTTPQEVDPRALDEYRLLREGPGRIAGREATVFLLEPRDALRYAQRLWADHATGLVLRADVLGMALHAGGRRPILESTSFSEIAVGVRAQPEAVTRAMRRLEHKNGYRVMRPTQQRTTLEQEGWVLARPVRGFVLSGCVRRGMVTAGDDDRVLQAVFTDGLTHVSVFVENFEADRHGGEMAAQRGATATLMTRRGNYWVTAVGDVPTATLQLFTVALERRRR